MDEKNETPKTEDLTQPIIPIKSGKKSKPPEDRDPHYSAASAGEQESLFARFGRDKVKAVPGFRNMLLSDLRKALEK